jgi:hypothetical protein
MNYDNIVLIFPTIALLSENYERIVSDFNYSFFRDNYNIHTLSDVTEFGRKNLFIYTPERFLSFIDKNEKIINFNFVFIDEVYKIDNDYLIDDKLKENERDVAYRLAVYYSLKDNADILLSGPYIEFEKIDNLKYNGSFDNFLNKNQIRLIDYNNYELVNKTYLDIQNKSDMFLGNELSFNFTSINKDRMLIEIIRGINTIGENTIIYCPFRRQVESYPKKIIKSEVLKGHNYEPYSDFINHITKGFKEDWVLIESLRNGIGIHHGLVPKYIQKEIISLFNQNLIKVLVSTTTITEGVNTSAKNLIVIDSLKGIKPLKKFDAKNIAGRAGRFSHHYSGRVIVLKNNFMEIINSDSEGIKHKNYDKTSIKDEIDLYYTEDEFLSKEDKEKKIDIRQEQVIRNIPDEIFDLYKVVSRIDKIKIYDEILKLNSAQLGAISALIRKINFIMDIDYDGFQIILKAIEPIIKNEKLKFLIEHKPGDGIYSVLTHLVHFYLAQGFKGSMIYKLKQGKTTNAAIRETAEFIYNTLKYQLVKYLGVFNIMYKFHISNITSTPFDEIVGLDILLVKLEYNALSQEGKFASDYGVPSNIIDYYENPSISTNIKERFDNYEIKIFNKIDSIIKSQD